VKTAEAFIQRAAASDMFEMQASRLAMERSQNQQLRRFTQEMVNDHAKTTGEVPHPDAGRPGPAAPALAGP
jgi:putative membrane protein